MSRLLLLSIGDYEREVHCRATTQSYIEDFTSIVDLEVAMSRVAAIAKGRLQLRSKKKVEEAVPDGAPEPSGKEAEVLEKVNRPRKRRHVDGAHQTEKAAPGSAMLDDNIVQFLTVQEQYVFYLHHL